jgi:predicted DNA-binding antitoxin AbrB/MazE fold protein
MNTQFEAIYEKGVFRPLEPVQLPEHQRVVVTIATPVADPEAIERVEFTLSAERWDEFCAALDAPPLNIPALRQLLTGSPRRHEHGSSAE